MRYDNFDVVRIPHTMLLWNIAATLNLNINASMSVEQNTPQHFPWGWIKDQWMEMVDW